MALAIAYDPVFLEHHTGNHPECPDRLEAIHSALQKNEILRERKAIPFEAATREELGKVHSRRMIDLVFQTANTGGGMLDLDTVVSPHSARVALQAVGAGLAAVEAVLAEKTLRAMCLVRPPGHHATPTRSMGFCLFNNIALAASRVLETDGINRAAVIDFDVHHGNGTQDVFYHRGDLFFFSIHQSPHYPGTGPAHEVGEGEGRGSTRNVPLPPGVDLDAWFHHFEEGLEEISRFDPDFILVSAGFDSHREDPLGNFPLDEEAFGRVGETLSSFAGDRGMISFLEGGYNLDKLGPSVEAYLQGLG